MRRAAERAGRGRLQRHRLVLERLVLLARCPVDGRSSTAPGIDQLNSGEAMMTPSAARIASDHARHLGRKTGRALQVEIIERDAGV